MKTNNLNQYENDYTKNWCGPVTILNIMKYRYAITVNQNFLMSFCIWLAWLKFWSSEDGAVFSWLYSWFVWAINRKLQLNFKVVTNKISKLKSSDWRTYWVWIKKYSSRKYNLISKDWIVTKDEIDYLKAHNLGVWHNLAFDWTGWGYLIDTNGTKIFKFPLENLKYWQENNLFRDNIRTIEPNDEETKQVCALCIRLFQAEKKWKLDQYIEMNQDNKYMIKALDLYMYGR